MFDIYKTKTMLGAIKQMEPVHSFLRDRYAPTNPRDVFASDEVLVEYKDATNRKLAPIVVNGVSGITVDRKGYETFRMEPPKISLKRELTEDVLSKKGLGEAIFSELTPAQRQQQFLAEDLVELDQMITNREEFIVSKLLFNNGYTLKQHADEYGTLAKDYEMKFYTESTNPAVYAPGIKWNAEGSDKLADLYIMVRKLTTAGNAATDVLLGADAVDEFMADAAVQKLLDLNNYDVGSIAPQLMADGATLLGIINVRGHRLNLISYDGTHEDEETGAIVNYIPAKSICVTSPGCARGLAGCVTQMEQSDGQFHSYTGRRVPRHWFDKNGRELQMTSKPLYIPKSKNPFISAVVLD